MPDSDPQLRQVILYRLDSLDRNVSRLVTNDAHTALVERVARLEAEEVRRDAQEKQVQLAVIVAVISAVGSVLLTLIGG